MERAQYKVKAQNKLRRQTLSPQSLAKIQSRTQTKSTQQPKTRTSQTRAIPRTTTSTISKRSEERLKRLTGKYSVKQVSVQTKERPQIRQPTRKTRTSTLRTNTTNRRRQYKRQKVDKVAQREARQRAHYDTDRISKLKDIGSGRILIMVACGPSVRGAPLDKLTKLDKIDFMVINKAWGFDKNICPPGHEKIWPPRFWLFCDRSQYRRNMKAYDSYTGTIINSGSVRAPNKKNHVIVRHRGGKGFSRDLTLGFHIGRSSTFAAMQVAYYMNYDKVYIFGLDMAEVDGKLHSYGVNQDVKPENRKSRFPGEAEHYQFAAQLLTEKERKKFTICSSYNPWDFVKRYERLDQKEAPDIILKRHSQTQT